MSLAEVAPGAPRERDEHAAKTRERAERDASAESDAARERRARSRGAASALMPPPSVSRRKPLEDPGTTRSATPITAWPLTISG